MSHHESEYIRGMNPLVQGFRPWGYPWCMTRMEMWDNKVMAFRSEVSNV